MSANRSDLMHRTAGVPGGTPPAGRRLVDAPVESYLAAVVDTARTVLGADLVGAYAAGSLALDAYQPGRSDVDVALVCRYPLDGPRKRALVSRLVHESLPCPARGLELVVYRQEIAHRGSPEPGFELELNSGPRMSFRATYSPVDRPPSDGLFWYALDRSILRQSGRTLMGPPANETFAAISRAELRRLLMDALTWWLARPAPSDEEPAPGADDAVLGACRALVRMRCGVWMDKVGSGRCLLDAGWRVPVIERAIDARNGTAPPPSAREARDFQRRILAEISAA